MIDVGTYSVKNSLYMIPLILAYVIMTKAYIAKALHVQIYVITKASFTQIIHQMCTIQQVCKLLYPHLAHMHTGINPKRAGGQNPHPFQHFLLYLCQLLFFRSETSWLFFFKPCARFKTIFIKIRPRVMTRRCVIARWVQRKTDFPLKLHTNRVFLSFLSFRIHFHYVLSYLFGLFGVRTCVSILWHTSLLTNAMQLLLEKIAKNHDFGDFWWF